MAIQVFRFFLHDTNNLFNMIDPPVEQAIAFTLLEVVVVVERNCCCGGIIVSDDCEEELLLRIVTTDGLDVPEDRTDGLEDADVMRTDGLEAQLRTDGRLC